MPFGKKGRTVRTYKYGALPPREGWEEALEQHFLRNRFWNNLVELEHKRRDQREAIIAEHIGEIEDDDERKERRRQAFKDAGIKEKLKTLDKETYAQQKEIRQQASADGLYWGNNADVEQSWMTACRGIDKPRFRRFDRHNGKVALPTTNGLPVADLGSDTRVRIEPIEKWSDRAGKKHDIARLLRVRVGSDPPRSRNPIWLALPIFLHRPLPETGIVRATHVTWRKRGTKTVWSVSFVVEIPDAVTPEAGEGPVVAVDLAWRKVDNGLRVAFWMGEDGQFDELRMDARWLAGMKKIDDLRSIRDQHVNAMRPAIATWLKQTPNTPEWLREEAKTLPQWRSPARFAALAIRWRNQRFTGDDAGFEMLEAWRKRDKHLLEYEAHYRAQLIDHRRHLYRNLAARLSREYSRAVFEDFNLARVAQAPQNKEVVEAVRHQRVLASPFELRSAFENAFKRDHGPDGFLKVSSTNTTLACWKCGEIDEWDPITEIDHKCSRCGTLWDQDENACRNMLQRANLMLTADS